MIFWESFMIFHFQHSLASIILPPVESVKYWPQVESKTVQSVVIIVNLALANHLGIKAPAGYVIKGGDLLR